MHYMSAHEISISHMSSPSLNMLAQLSRGARGLNLTQAFINMPTICDVGHILWEFQ